MTTTNRMDKLSNLDN